MMTKARIKKTVNLLPEYGIDALLVEDPLNIFYLTGLDVSAGSLLIGKKEALFLDGRYFEALKDKSPVTVKPITEDIFQFGTRIGFDREKTSYGRYETLKKASKNKVSLHPVENIVKNKVRIIKSLDEIALLKKAAKLAAKGFSYAVNQLKTGVTEIEIAQKLKIFWLENGSDGPSFEPIVAFGVHTACPHHRPTDKKLKKGDIVLFDLGANLHKYASDMTRVLFFGKPNSSLISIYEIVHEAHEKALSLCKPGESIFKLDTAARKIISKAGFADQFPHSLGHGIGLEVHEAPLMPRKKPSAAADLEPGMALTIEPGVYVPGSGGVRIEDTIIITKSGYESITPLSKDITILN